MDSNLDVTICGQNNYYEGAASKYLKFRVV